MDRLIPLSAHYTRLQRLADDAAWDGDMDRAKRLDQRAREVRQRIENGEQFEVAH